jgi:hypothetical protein
LVFAETAAHLTVLGSISTNALLKAHFTGFRRSQRGRHVFDRKALHFVVSFADFGRFLHGDQVSLLVGE